MKHRTFLSLVSFYETDINISNEMEYGTYKMKKGYGNARKRERADNRRV